MSYKTESFWDDLSNLWSYYEDRVIHNSLWDATESVYDGIYLKSRQSFYSKNVNDVFVKGYSNSFVNSYVSETLYFCGLFNGNRNQIQVPNSISSYLPIIKKTAGCYLRNDEVSGSFKLPMTEFYIDSSSANLNKSFFSPSSSYDISQPSAKIFHVDGYFLVMYGGNGKIFKSDDSETFVSDISVVNNLYSVVSNVFSVVKRGDFLIFACGLDGISVYEFLEAPFSFVRQPACSSQFPNIEHLFLNSNFLFASSGKNTALLGPQNNNVYVIDVSFTNLFQNSQDFVVSVIDPPVGQDYEVNYIFVSKNILNIVRFLAPGIIEQHSLFDISNPVFIPTSVEKDYRPSPTSEAILFNFYKTPLISCISFVSSGFYESHLYSFRDSSNPKKLNSSKIENLSEPQFAFFSENINNIFFVGADSKAYVFDTNDLQRPVFINTYLIGNLETCAFSGSKLLHFDPTLQDVFFTNSSFSHSGLKVITFDDLVILDASFFTELNKSLYSEVSPLGTEGFMGVDWSLYYSEESDLFTFEITNFNYTFSGNPQTKLIGEDKLLFSSSFSEGDYISLFDNGLKEISLPATYSLDFFVVNLRSYRDRNGEPIQYKSIVSLDLTKVESGLLNIIKTSGISGTGVKFYKPPTPNKIIIRDQTPIPFYSPKTATSTNRSVSSSVFNITRLTYSLDDLSQSYFLIQTFDENVNFVDEVSEWDDSLNYFSEDPSILAWKENIKILVPDGIMHGRWDVVFFGKTWAIIKAHQYAISADQEMYAPMLAASAQYKFRLDPNIQNRTFQPSHPAQIICNEVFGDFRLYLTDDSGVGKHLIGTTVKKTNTTPNDSDQWVIIDVVLNHAIHGSYIVLFDLLATQEVYIPTSNQNSVSFFTFNIPIFENITAFSFADSEAKDRNTQNIFKNYGVYTSFFSCDLSYESSSERVQSFVPELWSVALPHVHQGNIIYRQYDEKNPEDFLLRYTVSEGRAIFSTKPVSDWFYAPLAFENLSIISKVFSPLVSASESELDSESFKKKVQALFYLYSNGPVVERLKYGINVFGFNPTSIYKEATVVDINDFENVVVSDSLGQLYVIELDGLAVSQDVYVGKKLKPFQPLVSGVEIKDEVSHPRWWNEDYISILSPIKEYQEYATTENFTQSQRIVLNEILKHNAFGISINARVVQRDGKKIFEEIINLVENVKPSYLYAVLYSKLFLGDGSAYGGGYSDYFVEDYFTVEAKFIINSTFFQNIRNRFFTSDNPITETRDFEMGRQTSFQLLEEACFLSYDSIPSDLSPINFEKAQTVATLPASSELLGAAKYGSSFFIYGMGLLDNNQLHRFDTTTNTLTEIIYPIPEPPSLTRVYLVNLSGKIYLLGGYSTASLQQVGTFWEYDPTAPGGGQWSEITPLNYYDLSYAALTSIGDTAFFFGGFSFANNNVYKNSQSFKKIGPDWVFSTLPDMPDFRFLASAASYLGKIYVFGGKSVINGPDTNTLFVYDPNSGPSGSWSTKTPAPIALSSHTSWGYDNKIFILGGPTNDLMVYDILSDSWSFSYFSIPFAMPATISSSLVMVGNEVFRIGGQNVNTGFATAGIVKFSMQPSVGGYFTRQDVFEVNSHNLISGEEYGGFFP